VDFRAKPITKSRRAGRFFCSAWSVGSPAPLTPRSTTRQSRCGQRNASLPLTHSFPAPNPSSPAPGRARRRCTQLGRL